MPLLDVIFSLLSSFLHPSGLRCNSLSMLLWQKDSRSNLFFFPFETCEQCTSFSENIAVTLYPISLVALAFE